MQKKKNIRLLISLSILLVLTIVLLFLFNRNQNPVVDKTIFRVEDLTSIDKVVLEKAGVKTELVLDASNRWKVNGQPVDPAMIDVLFATLQQAEPKREVSEKLSDSIKSTLVKEGVHVTLFQGTNEALTFIAGGNASKTQAYFAQPEGDVYVMIIPGYRVYTSGIFELETAGWRDKYIFNFNWQNFQSLNVSFPASPTDDFEVSMGKEYFEVKGIAQADTTRLNDFLDAVSLLTVDQYLSKEQTAVYDTALQASQGFSIVVKDISGKTYDLKLYAEPGKSTIFGMVQGSYPAIFDARKILPLMKNKGWFVKK